AAAKRDKTDAYRAAGLATPGASEAKARRSSISAPGRDGRDTPAYGGTRRNRAFEAARPRETRAVPNIDAPPVQPLGMSRGNAKFQRVSGAVVSLLNGHPLVFRLSASIWRRATASMMAGLKSPTMNRQDRQMRTAITRN